MHVFGMRLSREELLERVSSMRQLTGTRVFEYAEGKARGTRAVEIGAGCGLHCTVLLDRGMDIGDTFFRGIPLSWSGKAGVCAPTYYQPHGHGWQRTFYGGLLTTCGLSHIGEPCEYQGEHHGLHGRISNTPAERVRIDEYWEGGEFITQVTGSMREAMLYKENLVLTRRIKSIYGQKRLLISDIIENQGYRESPLMLMYHINFPFPLVSEHTRLYTSAARVEKDVVREQEGAGDHAAMTPPLPGSEYETFVLHMPPDRDMVYGALINERLNMGVYLKYDRSALPICNQWKMLAPQEYTVALEPCNTYNVGIQKSADRGWLPMLQPGETLQTELEIGVLDGAAEIAALKQLI